MRILDANSRETFRDREFSPMSERNAENAATFQPKVSETETPGPIDRAPGTPGSGKN